MVHIFDVTVFEKAVNSYCISSAWDYFSVLTLYC